MPPPGGIMSRPQVLIDLTGDATDASDDEATRSAIKRPRSSHRSSTGAPFLASNHGLPKRTSANTDSWARSGVLGTNYLLNGAQYGGTNSGIALRNGYSPRQDIKLEHNGAPGPTIQSAFHEIENSGPRKCSKAKIQPHSGIKRRKTIHQGELPGTQYRSSVIFQQYLPSRHHQPRTIARSETTGKTVITGASRAAASRAAASEATTRISREGAIQKPTSVQTNSCNERVSEVLRRQLIPHVTEAVKPYRERLLKVDRSEMGSKIASDLVSEQGFMKDLGNRESLSNRYETYLATKAKVRAAMYFRKLQAKGRTVLPLNPTGPSSGHDRPCDTPSGDFSEAFEPTRLNSEVSTDTEEVFDLRPSLQSNISLSSTRSRGHSFSPATSFSNDPVDAMSSLGGDEEMDDNRMRYLPKRSSRAAQPFYARPKRTRAKRNPFWGTQKPAVPSSHPVVHVQDDEQSDEPEVILLDELPQRLPTRQSVTTMTRTTLPKPQELRTQSVSRIIRDPIGELLRQRELHGMAPVRARYGQSSFKAVASSYFEDCFVRQSEWTDCSGTILSVTWTSPEAFICGAVAHSDCNHMQYNKPGNLLLGSIAYDTLRSFPDHRTIRPVVSTTQNANNALEAMRQTQDPWMYAPVVTTAHSEYSGFTFTASFDKTVKIWSLMDDGSSMILKGTWMHEDRVNFVAASKHHDRVATASESMSDAVRVYNLDEEAVLDSSYDQYCGNKASIQAEEVRRREKWAYYPSTIQWGLAERVKYLLLVGWSPRSDSGEDTDIPEDKRNTGELCLWNSLDSSRVPINSAHFQNVFEVIWHPTQPFFLAATSPSGNFDIDTTKTQIRLFGLNATGGFINNKTFDCPAWDVNELTIMPTTGEECFVTVSCTDRCTYVYDSKRGDQPIHVLQHGESLDEPENEDSGVKFASWGNSGDRFYTGSSDGELKAWDIKAPPGRAFVRNILKLSGGIYAGSFSKDFSKLIIGDDTGKVHLLSVDDSDLDNRRSSKVRVALQLASASNGLLPASIKRPKLIIPHPESTHPDEFSIMQDAEQSSAEIANQYLAEGQLRLLPNDEFPMARKAVFQGPNYDETLLYRFEAHEDNDATQPLLPQFLHKQQFQEDQDEHQRTEEQRIKEREQQRLKAIRPPPSFFQSQRAHQMNLDFDLSFEKLSLSTQVSLQEERAEIEGDFIFDYEIMPSKKHPFLND